MLHSRMQGSSWPPAAGGPAGTAAPAAGQRPPKKQKVSGQPAVSEAQRLAVLAAVDAVIAGRSAGDATDQSATPAAGGAIQTQPVPPALQTNGGTSPATSDATQLSGSSSPASAAALPAVRSAATPGGGASQQADPAAAVLAAVDAVLAASQGPAVSPPAHSRGAPLLAAETATHAGNAAQRGPQPAPTAAAVPPPASVHDAAALAMAADAAVIGGGGAASASHQPIPAAGHRNLAGGSVAAAPAATPAATPAASDSEATELDTDGSVPGADAISTDEPVSDDDVPATRPPLRKVRRIQRLRRLHCSYHVITRCQ